ncbi:MAG: amino acid ABC transporter substrate-binding protein [Desulfobacter sp.]|nr:MAG: amino acid ABC transporter substrate-binding protein [Desulfobacter sp.]
MKRSIVVFICVWFCSLLTTQAWSESMDVACDEWPPYQVVEDSGKVSGFSTEVVKAVFERMGVTLNSLKAYPWKRALNNVQTGKVHALFSANFTQERTAFAWYPEEPLIDSPWVIWVKEGSGNTYTSLEDLKGKTVGVVNGYSYTEEFWDFVKANKAFQGANSDETNFKKLSGGRFEYAVAELGNGYHILKKLGIKGIVPVKAHPIKSAGLFIMFNKEKVSRELVEKFSQELKKFKMETGYQNLVNKYFS